MRRVWLAATALAGVVFVATATPAGATLLPSLALDGPNSHVRELGGVAMADDGTGGAVYLRRDPADGRVHVYAARFDGQRWWPPMRVDVDQPGLPQPFDSSWARIGAARHGRLVVTWVHPRARDPETDVRFDALYSAVLPRGGDRFLPPLRVDSDVRDSRNATFPSLAMNSSGQALLAYRVVTAVGGSDPGVPVGFVRAETRVARFNGTRWSVLGTRADRNEATFVRPPTADRAPQVAIDPQGNGVIAFQEPDDDGIERIWARRIFGASRFGVPLLASPRELGGRALNGAADQPAVAAAPFGRVTVAWRQQPGTRSPIAGTRVFVNNLPSVDSEGAGRFTGAVPADGAGDGAPPAPAGVSVSGGRREGFALAFAGGNDPFLTLGDDSGRMRSASLSRSTVPAAPLVVLGGDQRAVVAWRSASGGGQVAVQQRDGDRLLAAGGLGAGGGAVNGLALAGSGHGDAIAAVHQGSVSAGRIAVRVVDAPPEPFGLQVPSGWVRARSPVLRWEAAVDALGPVRYRVTVDRRTLGETGARVLRGRATRRIPDGVRQVSVMAIDGRRQGTATETQRLRIDRRPPRARVRRSGRLRVRLTVRDGRKRTTSGPARRGTVVRWGDGKLSRGGAKLRHTYSRPGRYRIVVRLRDRAGNRARRRLRVRVFR